MAQTPNYSIDLLDEGQTAKETTINDGFTTVDTELDNLETLKAPLASPVFTGIPELPIYTVGTLPAVGSGGAFIFVSDATGASVTGSLCFSNGTSYIDVTTHIAVV